MNKIVALCALVILTCCLLPSGVGVIDSEDVRGSVERMAGRLISYDPVAGEQAIPLVEMLHAAPTVRVGDLEPPILDLCDLHDDHVRADLGLTEAQRETYLLTTEAIRKVFE